MTKRIIGIVLLIVLCGALFAACKEPEEEPKETEDYIDYHTEKLFGFIRRVIDSDPQGSGLKGAFLESVRTKFVSYLYVDPETGDQEFRYDGACPSRLWYIIKDQESLEDLFDDPPEVDFESQMIVLVFVTVGHDESFRFEKTTFKDNELCFFELRMNPPLRRFPNSWALQALVGYKLDRLDGVESASVVFKTKNWGELYDKEDN